MIHIDEDDLNGIMGVIHYLNHSNNPLTLDYNIVVMTDEGDYIGKIQRDSEGDFTLMVGSL